MGSAERIYVGRTFTTLPSHSEREAYEDLSFLPTPEAQWPRSHDLGEVRREVFRPADALPIDEHLRNRLGAGNGA